MRTGYADLPLHYGKCPRWLFNKMKIIGKEITEAIILEFGKEEYLKRISDPFFFQALGCVMAFDWHSSGITTTVLGALKEGVNNENMGINFLGGKGRAARKTLQEIENLNLSERKIEILKRSSKLVAKVDNNAIQDGYQLYHHSFIVLDNGKWAVIQQGLSEKTNYARRYHWISENIKSFVVEPHLAICCDTKGSALNMVAVESEDTRKTSVDLARENPNKIKRLILESDHRIDLKNYSGLINSYEFQPKNYEELLLVNKMGPKSIRALALISHLIYGTEVSWEDPVKFSFAHGGKDNFPYPVDKNTYDSSIEVLKTALENAKIGNKEKLLAIKRLKYYHQM